MAAAWRCLWVAGAGARRLRIPVTRAVREVGTCVVECWGVRVSNVWLSASTSQKVSTSLQSRTFLKTTPVGYADPPSAVHVRYIRPKYGCPRPLRRDPPSPESSQIWVSTSVTSVTSPSCPRRLRRLRRPPLGVHVGYADTQVVHVGYIGYTDPPKLSFVNNVGYKS